jgi:Flp pilus assembly protein TadD
VVAIYVLAREEAGLMKSKNSSRRVSLLLVAAALVALVPVPVSAQTPFPAASPIQQPLPNPNDPAAMLSSNLKILAQNPYDVDALLNAGLGALAVGDANAAIGFLARAEELSPRNGRIKAALGSALTMVERPIEAQRYFAEALALGVAEGQIAKDRGLAWDLQGDPRRAQRDYAAALRYRPDDEITRRYALSLGISGDKDAALKMLDPLIKRGDQAAWRDRAFIYAMNGDMTEAGRIVRAVSAPSLVPALTGFLARLPSLNASQRAHAVNFGTMPSIGPQVAMADPSAGFRSVGTGVNTGLVTPASVDSRAQANPQRIAADESPRERKKREKREKELERIAAKSRKEQPVVSVAPPRTPSSVAVAQPKPSVSDPALPPKMAATVPPAQPALQPKPLVQPVEPSVSDPRVGRKIAEVDDARMPPIVREAVRPALTSPAAPPKVVVIEGANSLPAPTGASPSLPQPSVPAPSVPAPSLSAPQPKPILTDPSVVPPVVPPLLPPTQSITVPPDFSLAGATKQPSTDGRAIEPVAAIPVAQPKAAIAVPKVSPSDPTPAPVATQSPNVTVPTTVPTTVSTAAPVITAAQPLPVPVQTPAPVSAVVLVTPDAISVPSAAPSSATPSAEQQGLGSIISGLEVEPESEAGALPSDAEFRARQIAAKRKEAQEAKVKADAKAKADADAADKVEAAEKKKAELDEQKKKKAADDAEAKRNPPRIWVQIATGSNRSGLPITWRKLKSGAPKALEGQSAWFAPFRATNRLVIGPFKSSGEARAMVNRLAKEEITATTWTSDPGEDVTKLGGR